MHTPGPCEWAPVWRLQASILEWTAFPFSRGSSQPRYQTQVSHMTGAFFTREGNGNQLQYSAGKIPWTEEPGRMQSWGCYESDTTEHLPEVGFGYVILFGWWDVGRGLTVPTCFPS